MDALDSWYPVVRTQRTTRSSQDGYIFAMAPMGRPIIRTTYSLADVLAVENELLIEREDTDAVYRGEKKPGGDPLGAITLQDLHDIIMSDADEGESEVSSEDVVMSDAEDVVMVDAHDAPRPPSSSTPASSPAPDDVVSSEECSTVPVPATPRRPITYSRRDRERYSARREQTFSEHVAAQEAQMLENPTSFTSPQSPSLYRSRGAQKGRCSLSPGSTIIDPATYVLGVIVGAPKGEGEWWANIIDEGAKVLDRASRNADFHNLAEGQRRLRLGVAFGEEEAAPHGITNLEANLKEIHRMETEEPLAAIAGFAERGHAHVTSLVAELIRREIAFPSYKHSIFTTTEIQLGGDLDTFKNTNVAFNTWELLTFIGSWDSKTGGGIHFSDQEGLVEVVPGATIAFLSGAKSYTLMPIAAHETRYIVRQYVHASVLRWVQKGGRSDVEFACVASDKEVEAWDMLRVNRGRTSLRLFSKLDELYVL
ncbi:hypothetical protein C8R47DRAFT_1226389 [Mycena vitilis]|nr:hypothetical protein C8R47DRAFT_1226389 [Mycena vitilis]